MRTKNTAMSNPFSYYPSLSPKLEDIRTCICNVSSAWRDQMSSSDSVAIATENASRLGYKQVCVNYFRVASHDYISIRK